MSVEQMADPSFPLRDIQSRHVKSLFASMDAGTFNYCNGMITLTWSTALNPTKSSMQDGVAEDDDRKFVEEGFKMVVLGGRDWTVMRTSSRRKVDVSQEEDS